MLFSYALALFSATAAVAAPAGQNVAVARSLEARGEKWGNAAVIDGPSCPGALIHEGDLDGKNAHWELYYSPEKGGTNCLFVLNKTGVSKYMRAWIREKNNDGHKAIDAGIFKEYAGSARVYGVAKKCIEISVAYGAASYWSFEDTSFNHCG